MLYMFGEDCLSHNNNRREGLLSNKKIIIFQ